MSTTVTYKGNVLTTATNQIKVLQTGGTYLEDDITITDVTQSGDGYVWQDQNGYVHLSDEESTQISVGALSATQNGTYTAPTGTAYSPVTVNVSGGGGLEYETGTWTPEEVVAEPTIYFTRQHSTAPMFVMMVEDGDYYTTANSNYAFIFVDWINSIGASYTYQIGDKSYGMFTSRYKSSGASDSGSGSVLYSQIGLESKATSEWFVPSTNSTSRYWRPSHIYKWIAVWAPTT